jgi:putative tryptophan/tyrosine transport system substrate-binding protein
MKRRDFITLVGGSVAWPLAALAQEHSMPVIGFLNSSSPEPFAELVAAFHQGLAEYDYKEGRNLKIEYRWAKGDENRLKAMAIELVEHQVALIAATGGTRSAGLAKEATDKIPILFISGTNPVDRGLVRSINRPGGNATGVSADTTEMLPKRLEMLQELLPPGTKIAILVSPGTIARGQGAIVAETETKFAEENGLIAIRVHNPADFDKELSDGFESAVKRGARALLVSGDPFFYNRRHLVTELAARYALPAVYPGRDWVAAGGLLSYAPSFEDAYQKIGAYAGRILRDHARPEDLPVVFPQKWELVINIKTAKALPLKIPPWFLTRITDRID